MVVLKFHSCYLAGALRETNSEGGSSSEFTLDSHAFNPICTHDNPEINNDTPACLDEVDASLYKLGMLPCSIDRKTGLQVEVKKEPAKDWKVQEKFRPLISNQLQTQNKWTQSRQGRACESSPPVFSVAGKNPDRAQVCFKREGYGEWEEYKEAEENVLFSENYYPPEPSKSLCDYFDETSLLDTVHEGRQSTLHGVGQPSYIVPMQWPSEHIFNQQSGPLVPITFGDPLPQPILYPAAMDDSEFEFDHDIELEMALWLSLDDKAGTADRGKPIEQTVQKTIPVHDHPFKESPILTAVDFRDSSPSSLNLCGVRDMPRGKWQHQSSPRGGVAPMSHKVKLNSPEPGVVLQTEQSLDTSTLVHEDSGQSVEPISVRITQSKVRSNQTPPPSAFVGMRREPTPEGEESFPSISFKQLGHSSKLSTRKKKKKKKKKLRRKKRLQEAAAKASRLDSNSEKFDQGRKRGSIIETKISPLVIRKKEVQFSDPEARRDLGFRRSKKQASEWNKNTLNSPEKKRLNWSRDGAPFNDGSPISSTSYASCRRTTPSPLTHPSAIRSKLQSQFQSSKQHPLALTRTRNPNRRSPCSNAKKCLPPPGYSLPPKLHNRRSSGVITTSSHGEDVIRELRLVLRSSGRGGTTYTSIGDVSADECGKSRSLGSSQILREEGQTSLLSSCSEWSEEKLSSEEENLHIEEVLRRPARKPNPIEALKSTPGNTQPQRLQINSTPGNRIIKPWEKVLGSTPGNVTSKTMTENNGDYDSYDLSDSYYSESESESVREPQPMKALIAKYKESTVAGSRPLSRLQNDNPRSSANISSNHWAKPKSLRDKLAPKRFPFPRPLDKVKHPRDGPKSGGRSDTGLIVAKRPLKRVAKKYKLERQTKDHMSARGAETGTRHAMDIDSSTRSPSNRSCGLIFGPHSRDGSDLPSIRIKKRRKSRRSRRSPNGYLKAAAKQPDLARTPKPKPVPLPLRTSRSFMTRAREKPRLCPMKAVATKSATRSSRKKKKVILQEFPKQSSVNGGPWSKNRERLQTQQETEKSYLYYSPEGEKSPEVLPIRQSPIKQALSRTQSSSRRRKVIKKRKARWGEGVNVGTQDFKDDQAGEAVRQSPMTSAKDKSRNERVRHRLDKKCTTLQFVQPNCIVTIETHAGIKLRGVVEFVITTTIADPRGVKVKLKSGEIGRVCRLEKAVEMLEMVECPICAKPFPKSEVDNHLRKTHMI